MGYVDHLARVDRDRSRSRRGDRLYMPSSGQTGRSTAPRSPNDDAPRKHAAERGPPTGLLGSGARHTGTTFVARSRCRSDREHRYPPMHKAGAPRHGPGAAWNAALLSSDSAQSESTERPAEPGDEVGSPVPSGNGSGWSCSTRTPASRRLGAASWYTTRWQMMTPRCGASAPQRPTSWGTAAVMAARRGPSGRWLTGRSTASISQNPSAWGRFSTAGLSVRSTSGVSP
jgi:hypothetical protein